MIKFRRHVTSKTRPRLSSPGTTGHGEVAKGKWSAGGTTGPASGGARGALHEPVLLVRTKIFLKGHMGLSAQTQSVRETREFPEGNSRETEWSTKHPLVSLETSGNAKCWGPSGFPLGCRKPSDRPTHNPREGWENGTPPPHRDFKWQKCGVPFVLEKILFVLAFEGRQWQVRGLTPRWSPAPPRSSRARRSA